MIMPVTLPTDIASHVAFALQEDLGTGDITAQLIAETTRAQASVWCRERAVVCGVAWVAEVFRQVDSSVQISWHVQEGQQVEANTRLFTARGKARSLLTAERCALNYLQTLSGTATIAHHYASLVAHTGVTLLDTRKTIPGLRSAQKYAVKVGGCENHRMGLYDAFLIKENHIHACGSISRAIENARALAAHKAVEVEVEDMAQLEEAVNARADIIMLDNFSLPQMSDAVAFVAGRVRLEASGGVTSQTLVPIAQTGVDYISIGALTKDCRAIDLSMLFESL